MDEIKKPLDIPKDKYDVITVNHWRAPITDGAPLLTMPNVPAPLHGVAPRTILGSSTWNHMRKKCYYDAGYKCQACGKDLSRGKCHAHEVYKYNYYEGTAEFIRCVCLCECCHVRGIHTGRALTMFKKGNPLMPKQKILEGAENAFKLISEWNKTHHDEQELRAYATFIDYARWEPIAKEMDELIQKYNIKFYKEDTNTMAHWTKWKMRMGKRVVPTPYADREEWEQAMARNDKTNVHSIQPKDVGGIYDEVNRILDLTN